MRALKEVNRDRAAGCESERPCQPALGNADEHPLHEPVAAVRNHHHQVRLDSLGVGDDLAVVLAEPDFAFNFDTVFIGRFSDQPVLAASALAGGTPLLLEVG